MKTATVEITNLQSHYRINRRRIQALAQKVISRENLRKSISIVFVDNSLIRRLNRDFLGRNRITDVIAFNLDDGQRGSENFLGEVVVSTEKALKEARKRNEPASRELELYVVHGILHLAGYDDSTPENACTLHKREAELLNRPMLLSS